MKKNHDKFFMGEFALRFMQESSDPSINIQRGIPTVFSISRNRERLELNALLSAVFILGSTESTFQFWKLSGGIPFFLIIILFSNESFRDGILHRNLPAKSTVRKRFLK